jgi:hypothetical protein
MEYMTLAPSQGDFGPTVRPVVEPRTLNLFEGTFGFARLPAPQRRRSPVLAERTRQIKAVTGWSMRALATMLGTTHPTVSAVLDGSPTGMRAPELPGRIMAMADLVERLNAVTSGDRSTLLTALTSPSGSEGRSAVEYARQGDSGRAYIAALDVLRPPRQTGMMQGRWPVQVGRATSPLDED